MHREFLGRIGFGQREHIAGIRLHRVASSARERFDACLEALGLAEYTQIERRGDTLDATLTAHAAVGLTPRFETLGLAERLERHGEFSLRREIVAALLGSPLRFEYPTLDEFDAAIRVRERIVAAAHKTQLAFDTEAAERPWDYWTYDSERGFTLRPGKSLIEALLKATQPEDPAHKYEFSCYRATEYVLLLGIAQELAEHNPALYASLQKQWETEAIMSGRFHDTFLHEFGSLDTPLPGGYYIPGDRVWFRNPDARSADIPGYEGSWVFYLGGGQFSNFWRADRPYTLASKCLEIYHWRNGALPSDEPGRLCMDETVVDACVQESLTHPREARRILDRMLRLRDGRGIYAEGGCIDASRECPRPLCQGTADLRLPQSGTA